MVADFSPTGLRVLREVAQTGSFSGAARALGYTQSAVSRQVAALEAVAGRRLVERGRAAVALPAAGARLLPRAIRILDELDAALRETDDAAGPVRLGAFASAAAGLVPQALAALPRELTVTLREGTTPALTRALRAGTLDLAVLAQAPPFRPPADDLELTFLSERDLVVAVSATHPLAGARALAPQQLPGHAPAGRRPRRRARAAPRPGLGRQPERGRRVAARRVARAHRAARRALRRARLAREAADRRRRAGDHDARAGRGRRGARGRGDRGRPRRAARDAKARARPPARTARRRDRARRRRAHRRRRVTMPS